MLLSSYWICRFEFIGGIRVGSGCSWNLGEHEVKEGFRIAKREHAE